MISVSKLLYFHLIRNVFCQKRIVYAKVGFLNLKPRPRQISDGRRLCSSSGLKQQLETKTAGLIVIGDEILKGQVHDTNSYFIAKVLYDLGVKVKRISVVGDCEADIIKEVKELSPQCTFVITSGGIGPTHDDITFEAIAKAFGKPLVPHPELVQICSSFYKTNDLRSPPMKLAHIPKSARLTFGYDKITKKKTFYPNVSINNVYIFPGVPQLLQRLFLAVSDELFGDGCTKFHLREVYLATDEASIAHHINVVVNEFPNVTFGSYPKFFDCYYKVRVTVESQIEDEVMVAHKKLVLTLPKEHIIEYDKAPLQNAYDKLMKLVHKKEENSSINAAIVVMQKCFQNYKPEEICVYFDGEKESTAVLHLYYAFLMKHCSANLNICALYVEKKCSEKMDDYIKETTARYNLNIKKLNEGDEPSLGSYFSLHPQIKALVVGSTRDVNTIKNCALLSDDSVVKLIQPFETWTDSSLWDFIYSLYLPHFR